MRAYVKILSRRIFGDNDIDFTLADYCDLVDATGRCLRNDKKGFIDDSLPPVLNRLGLDTVTWLDELNQFKFKGRKAIGTIERLKLYIKNIKNKIKLDSGLKPALE